MSTTASSSAHSDFLRTAASHGSLLLLAWGIFGQVVGFGLIDTWDDYHFFLSRHEVQAWFDATWTQRLLTPSVGYPLPIPTFLYFLVGQAPTDWVLPLAHGLNLAFHSLNILLIYALAKRWLAHQGAAWCVAALWTAHPVMAEAVAWVTDLKIVLMGTFALSALYAWDRYLEGASRCWGWVTAIAVLGALGNHPQALALAPVLIVQALSKQDVNWRSLRIWAPLGAALLFTAVYYPVASLGHYELVRDQTAQTTLDLSYAEHIRRIGAAFAIQLRNIANPTDLHPVYVPNKPAFDTLSTAGFVALAVVLVLTLVLWQRDRKTGWGLMLAGGFYVPVSGLSLLPRLTADTYTYMPLFGLLLAFAALLEHRVAQTPKHVRLTQLCVGLAIVTLAPMTFLQTRRWRAAAPLFEPALEAYPASTGAMRVLSYAYYKVDENERALEILEDGYEALRNRRAIPVTMIDLYERVGKPAKAAKTATAMILHQQPAHDYPYRRLLHLVVKNNLPLVADASEEARTDDAVALALARLGSQLDASFLLRLTEYLAIQGAPELAGQSFGMATSRSGLDCQWWEHALKLGKRYQLQTSQAPPETCRSDRAGVE
ncbi:hypothetical protein FIV42_04065 [Persicimonas caeni]|uniref:Uncharacterized protein n=1 Tax=Persicimonas caeni TaxID=2292766 RepID=A0A4Y6PNQ5_PERCE|nr:hypothetical protein [Persicimonas caeni]QDG49942.1 hypothetical protein FIV42_04065 [Persicimonas caeni]QED31163.1 hypothetical protein FRD00_04060 [Persicimonas caeni]